jgi:hypothetical protein
VVNENNFTKKNARKQPMDFMKVYEKNRYVNFVNNRSSQSKAQTELEKAQLFLSHAKMPQIRPILSQTFKTLNPEPR